jgi:copper transporter 1
MLAVMTFQAAYIISIVIGLGLGEILFGRIASAHL